MGVKNYFKIAQIQYTESRTQDSLKELEGHAGPDCTSHCNPMQASIPFPMGHPALGLGRFASRVGVKKINEKNAFFPY